MDELRKYLSQYKLDSLIYTLSNISKDMFKKNVCHEYRAVCVDRGSYRRKIGDTMITPWAISDIIYHAIHCCNDFSGKYPDRDDIPWIFAQYTNYTDRQAKRNVDNMSITELLYGLTQKQFWYQKVDLLYEQVSRNIELLKYIPNQINSPIPIEQIVAGNIGMTFDEFNKILIIIAGFCISKIDMADTTVDKSLQVLDPCFTQENIVKVLNYFTTDYESVRNSSLEENCLNIKPFIRTDTGKIFAVNSFIVTKKCSDGAYWLIREHYLRKGRQDFVNEFGRYFEQHFANILQHYLSPEQYGKLQESERNKTADWAIYSQHYILLIEQKSGLASLKTKREYPNPKDLKNFFDKFLEAFLQLDSTEKMMQEKRGDRIILKFALHYEDLYMQSLVRDDLVKENASTINNIDNFFIVGIPEMEKLINVLAKDETEYEVILEDLINIQKTSNTSEGKELEHILKKHKVEKNDYMANVKNHLNETFKQILKSR